MGLPVINIERIEAGEVGKFTLDIRTKFSGLETRGGGGGGGLSG